MEQVKVASKGRLQYMDYPTGSASNAVYTAIGAQDRIAGFVIVQLPQRQQHGSAASSRVSVVGVSPSHEGLPKEATSWAAKGTLAKPQLARAPACGTSPPPQSASMEQTGSKSPGNG